MDVATIQRLLDCVLKAFHTLYSVWLMQQLRPGWQSV